MSQFPSMPLFIDAYLADTTHLTTEEHGAYLLLLMAMWRRNGWVPDDDVDLARMCHVTVLRWQRHLKPRLMPFLVSRDGELSQKKLKKVQENLERYSDHQRGNINKRWQSKSKKNNDIGDTPAQDIPARVIPTITNTDNVSEPDGSSPLSSILPDGRIDRPPKKSTPRAVLMEILSAESADAVIDHRRSLRHPLTLRAAQLLAKHFAKAGDCNLTPDQAADAMIGHGWRGFEAGWVTKDRAMRQAEQPKETRSAYYARRAREVGEQETEHVNGSGDIPGYLETGEPAGEAAVLEPAWTASQAGQRRPH